MQAPESNKRKFKIAILDDDVLYGKLMAKKLRDHFQIGPVKSDCNFQITTYSCTSNFISQIPKSTDVVVIDYYLENGINALMLIEAIKKLEIKCKILIMSSSQNIDSYYKTFWNGAHDFIKKDKGAGNKACKIISTIYANKTSN